MKDNTLFIAKVTLCVMLAFFAVIVSYIAIPGFFAVKRAVFPAVVLSALAFFLLGLLLIFLALKLKERGKMKKSLILTGASASGVFVSAILHNLIYGLLIHLFGTDVWDRIGLPDEPLFFLLAIFVCPILFLIGAVSSIVLFAKRTSQIQTG